MKGRAVQRFVSGEIVFAGQAGVLARDGDSVMDALHLQHPVPTGVTMRGRMVLLVQESHLEHAADVMSKAFRGEKGPLFVQAVELGELHVSGGMLDEAGQILRLGRRTLARGRVFICVGEYVGSESNAIEVLAKAHDRLAEPTPACRALLPAHCPEDKLEPNGANVLSAVSVAAVRQSTADAGKVLSAEQVALVDHIVTCKRGAVVAEAAPGAGKTYLLANVLKNYIPQLGQREKAVVLLQQRTQRDEFLDVLRGVVSDPGQVAAVGRPVDSAHDDDLDTFDSRVLENMSGSVSELQTRIDTMRANLEKKSEGVQDIASEEGQAWKTETEELANLIFQRRRLLEELRLGMLDQVAVFVMTVDCFLQVSCGKSWLAAVFRGVRWRVGVVDEAHQLEFGAVYAAAILLDTAGILQDRAQEPGGHTATKHLREDAPLSEGSFFSWPLACHGAPSLRVWDHLPDSAIHWLRATRRFGPKLVRFLVQTSAEYGAAGKELTCGDGQSAPDTQLRCVRYYQSEWHAVAARGRLVAEAQPMGAQPGQQPGGLGNSSSLSAAPRAGGCTAVFQHMLFEGLLFLRALAHGRVQSSPSSAPLQLARGTKAVLSLFWSNDAGVSFNLLVRGALADPHLLSAFDLPEDLGEHRDVWRVLTPEAASGTDVLLCQCTVLPRTLAGFDLQGNTKDSKRRNVAYSRSTIATSSHECAECFQDPKAAVHWTKHWGAGIRSQDVKVARVDCSLPLSPVDAGWVDPACRPGSSEVSENLFEQVTAFVTPLKDTIDKLRENELGPLRSMRTQASIKITDAIRMGCDSLFHGGALEQVPMPIELPFSTGDWVPKGDIPALVSDVDALHDLLPKLLDFVGVKVRGDLADVTVLFLEATKDAITGEPLPRAVSRVAEAGRAIALHTIGLYPDVFAQGYSLHAKPMPNKRFRLGGGALQQCLEARLSLAVAAQKDGQAGREVVLYHGLSNASADHPPNAWPATFRRMPLPVAKCLLATVAFFAGSPLRKEGVHVVPPTSSTKDAEAAEETARDIRRSANEMARLLSQRHSGTTDARLPAAAGPSQTLENARAALRPLYSCGICDGMGVHYYFSARWGRQVTAPCPLCDVCVLCGGSRIVDTQHAQMPCPLCTD